MTRWLTGVRTVGAMMSGPGFLPEMEATPAAWDAAEFLLGNDGD